MIQVNTLVCLVPRQVCMSRLWPVHDWTEADCMVEGVLGWWMSETLGWVCLIEECLIKSMFENLVRVLMSVDAWNGSVCLDYFDWVGETRVGGIYFATIIRLMTSCQNDYTAVPYRIQTRFRNFIAIFGSHLVRIANTFPNFIDTSNSYTEWAVTLQKPCMLVIVVK